MHQRRTLLLLIWMLSGFLFAADGDQHAFELTWQPNAESTGFTQSFNRDTPFDKEPEIDGHDVFRGTLEYHGQTDQSGDVAFIWDKSGGKLYVDLNKDGDLTNDPNGVLATEQGGNSGFQMFPAFPLSFTSQNGTFRYRLTANMQGYDFFQQATFRIQSGYTGTVDLYGQKWHFSVNDNFQGKVQQDSSFSAAPTEAQTNAIVSLSLPRQLFLDGRCYEPVFEFHKTETGFPSLQGTLTEKTVPLAMLKVEGQWISQLVLGSSDSLVLPALSDQAVPIPAMSLNVVACGLKYDENKPQASPTGNLPSVDLSESQQAVLKIGGPLENSVDIERSGKVLQFNYKLVGAGGETYDARQITQYDDNKKPSVAIYKGDLQVGSGNFEYG